MLEKGVLKFEPCIWDLSFLHTKPFQILGPLHKMVNLFSDSTCKTGMSSVIILEISPVCHTTGFASDRNCILVKKYIALNVCSILIQSLEMGCASWPGKKEMENKKIQMFLFLNKTSQLYSFLTFTPIRFILYYTSCKNFFSLYFL